VSEKTLVKRIRNTVSSKGFFYFTLGAIIVSCLLFIVSVTYKIPPDEYYHFRFVEFYAGQPIAHGPFINNQGLGYFDLRDITRIPNYLYHYLLSFPLRGLRLVTNSIFAQVIIMRLVNLTLGIASLFMVRRILRQIKASAFIQNSVLFLLGVTGMLLWIFSSINYDVPAILLYLWCVSVCLKILQSKGITTKQLAAFCLLGILCVMVKVTFLPFLALLVVCTLYLKRRDLRFRQDLSLRKWKHALLIAALVIMSLLFIERIGGNIIKYHQIEVTCDKVHTYEQCMQDDVFSRNEIQLRAYAQQKAAGQGVDYHPYQFTQMWLAFMYERSHFYYGHEQMQANYGAKILAVATGAGFIALVAVFRKRIAESPGEKLLFWITLTYAAVMYLFNLQTYLKFGQPYAFQGRYLFPVIPFLYYFCVKLLVLTYKALKGRFRQGFVALVGVVFLLSVYSHLPILVFYRGTEAKWYSNQVKSFNQGIQDGLRKINIKPLL